MLRDNEEDSPRSKMYRMLLSGQDPSEPYLHSLIVKLQEDLLLQLKEKARIKVDQSRLLIGVYDTSGENNDVNVTLAGKLEEGQCFFKLRDNALNVPYKGKVAVSKNPCVHPGGTGNGGF